jgi:hypothetical protein
VLRRSPAPNNTLQRTESKRMRRPVLSHCAFGRCPETEQSLEAIAIG